MHPRIVLVGVTGSGKSSVANILQNGRRDGPFKVSDSVVSVTTAPCEHVSTLDELRGWTVVDTPGLGHFDDPLESEDYAAYTARTTTLTEAIINNIVADIQAKGGLIVLVHRVARMQLVDILQLKTLFQKLGSFAASVLVLFTHCSDTPDKVVQLKRELEDLLHVKFANAHALQTYDIRANGLFDFIQRTYNQLAFSV